MNIHEYQAKELFEKFGVATSPGKVARTPEEAEAVARELGEKDIVVKAQIHAGGRGKGTFKNGFKGGVHLVKSAAEAKEIAAHILGQTLVTHQTGPDGRVVNQVLVARSVDIAKEFYFAIVMDRATGTPTLIASTEGGVEIETVAEHSPEKILKVHVHPALGLQAYQARDLAAKLGLGGKLNKPASDLFVALFKLFVACDCAMVEVNPLVLTPDQQVLALDAKFGFDDNALYRHKDIVAMRDVAEEDPREVEASKFNLNYIGLDGDIACLVNGAGLAMATMDIIKHHGGNPANFLDVGGGASESQVTEAFKILVADPKVKAILVNIFGGIMQCDVIAKGIIGAVKAVNLPVPLVVRLEGTNVEAGKKLIAESGLPVITANDLTDAGREGRRRGGDGGVRLRFDITMSLLVPSEVKPLPNYRLWLRFPDGVEGVADLSHLVGQGVFRRWIEQPEAFDQVAIAEDGSLAWEGGLDLCSDALYLEVSGKPVEEVFPRLKGELLHA